MGPIDDELAAQLRRGFWTEPFASATASLQLFSAPFGSRFESVGETLEFIGGPNEELLLQHVQSAAQRSPGGLLV